MAQQKLPAFMFFTGDWMKDPALRSCSSGARGLWIDMLCLMFESDRRGYLQTRTAQPPTLEQLSRMTGNCDTVEVSRWLQELEDSGVVSKSPHGVYFSRRMVRDEHKRELCREAGKLGGNPTLKGHPKGRAKGESKGRSKRNPTLSYSYSPGERESVPDSPADTCVSACSPSRAREDSPAVRFAALVRIWTEFNGANLPAPRFLNPKREAATKRMFSGYKSEDDLAQLLNDWRDVCARISKSRFCNGAGERGWRANIDWAMRPDVMARILEGAYDDPKAAAGVGGGNGSGRVGGGARHGAGGVAPNAYLGAGNATCYES